MENSIDYIKPVISDAAFIREKLPNKRQQKICLRNERLFYAGELKSAWRGGRRIKKICKAKADCVRARIRLGMFRKRTERLAMVRW